MKKELVNITDTARDYINDRCAGGKYLVKVSVNNKGCSGHAYQYDLISADLVSKMDEVIQWPGGGICISGLSVMYLIGSTLDVKSNIFEKHLVWQNPHVSSVCGCGESFSIE